MVILEPMTEFDFQNYLEPAIAVYAQENITNGEWTEETALERARKQYAELLPRGRATPCHFLFTIVERSQQQKVGILWFALEEKQGQSTAFVYDVSIEEQYQRHGYGSQTFREMEKKIQELGASKISLHVFGQNHAAQQMYKKLGYVATSMVMSKTLGCE